MKVQELPPFHVLWVEDEATVYNPGRQGLEQDKDRLTGMPGRPILICNARTQKEADEKVATAPPGGYDLILLDWKYPKDEGQPVEYLGLTWLPVLRAKQPLACIAVLSGYTTERNLGPAVAALRYDGADEVIPKGTGLNETSERLQKALAHRRRENYLTQMPYLSNIVRITAEDLQLAVGRARAELQLSDLGPGHGTGHASEILEQLAQEVEKIGRRLPGEVKADLESVDCVVLAKQAVSRYIQENLYPIPVMARENCIVRTYRKDARNALYEILQNAVDAVNEVEPFPSYPAVRVDLKNQGNQVEITVWDKGRGFRSDAKKNLYKPDNCHWTKDKSRHKGVGLYVSHRMMQAVGGRIEVESSEEGSRVKLVVRDWS